ncbi:DNA sulfur modification protein DndD [Paenibacillus sp. Soil766]|uniref:DNA sulfur modification protein DndD n=1 Tax=Paenibacillus sp. Soil766 TaxID=1736404 RepID=UPI00070901AA|nr:DNA sulfur modification protein DndD [Paenibacillus sp. Soil766]KRF01090.1 DNA sulfur modification protein DndD [Paenibacillus sp. Soil766]
MIIKKLLLYNYKTYYGQQGLNLHIPKSVREESSKNIILIGGLNGAGKTTILKAIHYALFGQRGMSPSEHKRLFSNVLNNTFFDEGGRECSISLTLDMDSGEEWDLITKWTFDHNKNLVRENREITVRKPGMSLGKTANVENIAAYNRYIDKMIPYHAAPFFIFDGEEIKEIILRQNSNEMKEAIHKISGIEAYKQLISDLAKLKTSVESELAKAVNQSAVTSLEKKLSEIEDEIKIAEKKREVLIADRRNLDQLLEEAKTTRNNKMLLNSRSREVIISKQSQVAAELKLTLINLNQQMKEKVVEIILAEKVFSLQNQLRQESDNRQRKLVYEAKLTPYHSFFNQLLQHPIHPPLSTEQLFQLKEIGEELWKKENNIQSSPRPIAKEIHDLAQSDYNYLIALPRLSKNTVIKLVNRIEELQLSSNEIELELRSAPESVDIQDENEKIELLTKKIGVLDVKNRSLFSKINVLKEEKKNQQNNITRKSGDAADSEQLKSRLATVTKLEKAMQQYVQQMTQMKAEFIKEEFARMLLTLFRKQEEFGKIEFDINTYTIRLYNERQQEISIQDRSAGEMQMIASALIWALTKASDLSLPMVIDTPLGRLDSYHRNHLINHYYKNLSEQVIILSTDTEITREYVDLMKKHSYKQYMLDYNQEKKYTVIRDGYFDFIKV